jgi:hypothetical protein
MTTKIQLRRGTASQWTSANPTLSAGELGFETDTNRFKLGNGSSGWSSLSYFYNKTDNDASYLSAASASTTYLTQASASTTYLTITSAGTTYLTQSSASTVYLTQASASTAYQAKDTELTALAGLTSAADRLPYFTGSGTASLATFTTFGRSLVDDADAATARTTLGLGTMAVETASNYLTTANAATTYLTQSSASTTYLTQVSASTTYLTQSSASTTYLPISLSTNAQTGTTYTLVLSDAAKLVEISNTSAITLTVPTNASVAFPIGTQINILQTNTGQITVGGAGVTINATPGLKLRSQWSSATLIKRGTDTWVLVGDLSA